MYVIERRQNRRSLTVCALMYVCTALSEAKQLKGCRADIILDFLQAHSIEGMGGVLICRKGCLSWSLRAGVNFIDLTAMFRHWQKVYVQYTCRMVSFELAVGVCSWWGIYVRKCLSSSKITCLTWVNICHFFLGVCLLFSK